MLSQIDLEGRTARVDEKVKNSSTRWSLAMASADYQNQMGQSASARLSELAGKVRIRKRQITANFRAKF